MDPFVHLHVASGYSLQYGASHPHALVERAAEQEMDTLALTDRDGTYGAVKFAQACRAAGIRPVLGVDLAYRPVAADPAGRPVGEPRTPVRGGAFRDPAWDGLPRVTLLATAGGPGGGRAGWAAICRLVSAVHLAGERGTPGGHPRPAGPVARLRRGHGAARARPPSSGRRSPGAATTWPWQRSPRGARWCRPRTSSSSWSPTGSAAAGQGAAWGPGTAPHAARMAGLARRAGLGTVLSNAVRYADRRDAPIVDVLDAARRLVALDRRHVDRGNAEGFLKSGKQMHEVAEEICRLAGLARAPSEARTGCWPAPAPWPTGAPSTRAPTWGWARCTSPSSRVRRRPGSADADAVLRARCEGGVGGRYGSAPRQRIWKRLDDELEMIRGLGYASYFLTVGDVTDLIREIGVRCAARGSGAGSLVNYLLGVSGVDPIRHGLLMERFLSPLRAVAARHRRRRRVGPARRGLRGDPRQIRRRAVRVRLDDGHLPRPPRRPRRRRRARHAAGRDRRDRQGVPAHPGPRRPGRAARAARAARQRARRRSGST